MGHWISLNAIRVVNAEGNCQRQVIEDTNHSMLTPELGVGRG